MKNILVLIGRYLPGYKSGGPVKSIANLVEELGDEYNFYISCYDRDLGEDAPYLNIEYGNWNKVGKAKVLYIPEETGFTFKNLKQMYNNMDLIYLCGCFNDYSILTLVMKKLNIVKVPVIVASMGLFSPMAFKIKYKKKKFFVDVFNIFGMFKNIGWSVTSEMELREVNKYINTGRYYIAQDIPCPVELIYPNKNKNKDELRVVFLSRISPKKNLLAALQILQEISQQYKIFFDIYGPCEDIGYWNECMELAKNMPDNIEWKYCNEVPSKDVIETFRKYQVFLFPTLGENYGHVISEALSGGCLCVLSDQTPWLDLEDNEVGYAISLNDKYKFKQAIEHLARLDKEEYSVLSKQAVDYIKKKNDIGKLSNLYRNMFNDISNS